MPVKPVRPGTYISITGQASVATPIGGAEIVAVPFQHNWGPLGAGGLVQSIFDFEAIYGSAQTDGRQAVFEALMGAGGNGAGAVLPYRMTGTGGGSASIVLNNTAAAAGVTLTAKYPGTRANSLIATVIDYAADSTRNVLQIFDGVVAGDPLEQFIHVDGDLAGLVAQINLLSQYFTAAVTSGANPLNINGTGVVATGGADPTPTSTDYANALSALGVLDFSVLAFQNLTDPTIQTTVLAWVRQMASRDQPITWVVGGAGTDTLSTAIARSAALPDPDVINLGIGQYHDDYKGGAIVSTAQLAPRLAGILVGRGDARSLTFTRVENLRPVSAAEGTPAPSITEIEQAIQNGITVLSRSTSPEATLKVEKGVSTFTSTTDPNRPFDIFSDPRLVRLTNLFIRGMKNWGDDNVIGGSPVTQRLRDAVKSEVLRRIGDMVARGLVVPDTGVVDVPTPADPTLADAVPFNFGWQYTRTANYLLGSGRVR